MQEDYEKRIRAALEGDWASVLQRIDDVTRAIEAEIITTALEKTYNEWQAARMLGISHGRLRVKISNYGIRRPK